MRFARSITIGLTVALSTACGGGDSDPDPDAEKRAQQAQLQIQARAKEDLAKTLAIDTPCQSDNQCKVLLFQDENNLCDYGYKPGSNVIYSLISATARQAEETALEQHALVRQMRAIETRIIRCPAIQLAPLPVTVCVQNKCVQASPES